MNECENCKKDWTKCGTCLISMKALEEQRKINKEWNDRKKKEIEE